VEIRSFPAILNQSIGQPTAAKLPLSKVVALAAELDLCMLSCPVHAVPTSSGDTVRGLYDVLLSTMKNGWTLGQSGRCMQLEPVTMQTGLDLCLLVRRLTSNYRATEVATLFSGAVKRKYRRG
jgi:hypothetical protein